MTGTAGVPTNPTLQERMRVAAWLLRIGLEAEELSEQEAITRAAITVLEPRPV